MRYFVIEENEDESNVYVSDIPEGLVRKYQLLKGISRAVGWPADMAAKFSDIRPEGMRLTDWVATPFGWLLISDRFKELVEDTKMASFDASSYQDEEPQEEACWGKVLDRELPRVG